VTLSSYPARPFRPEHIAAAVVCRTEGGNLHAGLLYRDGEGVGALHLGWKDSMHNSWGWQGVWASPPAPSEKLVSAAGMCRLVWRRYRRDPRFPYSLRFGGTSFDAAGRLQLALGSHGLTCATLVLAVMNAVGIPLVVEETWPVRTDDDRGFIDFVRRFAVPKHLAVLEKEVQEGVRRIRRDEVVGACAVGELPAEFEEARAVADTVLEHLATP